MAGKTPREGLSTLVAREVPGIHLRFYGNARHSWPVGFSPAVACRTWSSKILVILLLHIRYGVQKSYICTFVSSVLGEPLLRHSLREGLQITLEYGRMTGLVLKGPIEFVSFQFKHSL
jgi:hypothetical protein